MDDDLNETDNSQNQSNASNSDTQTQNRAPNNQASESKHRNTQNSKHAFFLVRFWQWLRKWYTDPFRHRSNVAEKLTVFVTIVIAVVGGLQYSVYRQQKKIMESSGHQTDQLINAANIQAQAANSFSVSAAQINGQIQNAVIDLERPYVFVYPVSLGYNFIQIRQAWDQQIAKEHKLRFDITIFNLGISPAVRIIASKPKVMVGPDVVKKADRCSPSYGNEVLNIALPQQSQQQAMSEDFTLQSVDTGSLAPVEIQKIVAGTVQIVAFGGIKYGGIRGGEFETRYCFVFSPTGMPYGSCGCVGMK